MLNQQMTFISLSFVSFIFSLVNDTTCYEETYVYSNNHPQQVVIGEIVDCFL